jgi:hypothetical protein
MNNVWSRASFTAIVGCALLLSACDQAVSIGDPDGWHAINGNTIDLTGDSWDHLRAGGEEVTGTFPCEAV